MESKEKRLIYQSPNVIIETFYIQDVLSASSDSYVGDYGDWVPEEDLL